MIDRLFANTLYIKVFPNRFELKQIETGKTAIAPSPRAFTTNRLLVGEFSHAEEALNKAIKQLYEKQWFSPKPRVVIQPMEKVENGLSEVEERVLLELAARAGARSVSVWVGHNLSDSEVLSKAETKK